MHVNTALVSFEDLQHAMELWDHEHFRRVSRSRTTWFTLDDTFFFQKECISLGHHTGLPKKTRKVKLSLQEVYTRACPCGVCAGVLDPMVSRSGVSMLEAISGAISVSRDISLWSPLHRRAAIKKWHAILHRSDTDRISSVEDVVSEVDQSPALREMFLVDAARRKAVDVLTFELHPAPHPEDEKSITTALRQNIYSRAVGRLLDVFKAYDPSVTTEMFLGLHDPGDFFGVFGSDELGRIWQKLLDEAANELASPPELMLMEETHTPPSSETEVFSEVLLRDIRQKVTGIRNLHWIVAPGGVLEYLTGPFVDYWILGEVLPTDTSEIIETALLLLDRNGMDEERDRAFLPAARILLG